MLEKKARYRPRLNSYLITDIALILDALVYHFFCRNPNEKDFVPEKRLTLIYHDNNHIIIVSLTGLRPRNMHGGHGRQTA